MNTSKRFTGSKTRRAGPQVAEAVVEVYKRVGYHKPSQMAAEPGLGSEACKPPEAGMTAEDYG